MAYRRPRSQPRYGSPRLAVGSSFIPDLEKAVKREMLKHNVSRSFVIATAVAFALGIDEQPDYRKSTTKKIKPSDFRGNKALRLVEKKERAS